MVFDKPENIDSPIKKWPILNSLIPLIFERIFADLKVKPWPAWTSIFNELAYSTAFFNLLYSSLYGFFFIY